MCDSSTVLATVGERLCEEKWEFGLEYTKEHQISFGVKMAWFSCDQSFLVYAKRALYSYRIHGNQVGRAPVVV